MAVMKTYGRKKVGETSEVIFDLNELCRLCMSKDEKLVPIFEADDKDAPLTLRIMACVSLEVYDGDGLPNKVCHPCKFLLEKYYSFRKKCETVDTKLRSHLKTLGSTVSMEPALKKITAANAGINSSSTSTSRNLKRFDNRIEREEDLVGVTKVAYIQPDADNDPDNNGPDSITLSNEEQFDKAACTLTAGTAVKKQNGMHVDEDKNDSCEEMDIPKIEFVDVSNDETAAIRELTVIDESETSSASVSAKQVKSSTEVEVTTGDGSVIVMELMVEDEPKKLAACPSLAFDDELGEYKFFQCPSCPKSFTRRIQLRRHSSVHMKERGFSCGMCEKWFPTRSALMRHERIHTGERPFQCDICQKSFAQKEILYRHLLIHSDKKPFNRFSKGNQIEPRIYQTHRRTGNELKLHYCSLCPKVFRHASGLCRHLLSHTGKTFACVVCNKTFTDKSSLRRHAKLASHYSALQNACKGESSTSQSWD